jgi:hypothetical protein
MRRLVSVSVLLGVLIAGWAVRAAAAAGPSPEAVAKAAPILDEALRTATSAKGDNRDWLVGQIISLWIGMGADPSQLVALARAIPEDEKRTHALADIAVALAKRDLTAALHVARGIEDDRWRVEGLLRLARSLDKGQSLAVTLEALPSARRIENAELRSRALTDVAEMLVGTDPARSQAVAFEALAAAQASQFNRDYVISRAAAVLALTNLEQALGVAASLPSRYMRDRARYLIAEHLARKPDQAQRAAMVIEDPSLRDQALAALASALTILGRSDAALEVAHSIGDQAGPGAQARIDVARSLEWTDPERGREIALEALQAAQSLDYGNKHTSPLPRILATLAEQDPDGVVQLARGVADPATRAYALHAIASTLSRTDPERSHAAALESVDAARGISHAHQRAEALRDAVKVLSRTDPEKALEVARSIEPESMQGQAMCEVAAAVRQTDPARALRIIRSIKDEKQRAYGLGSLASSLADSDLGAALGVAHSIEDQEERAKALYEVARVILKPWEWRPPR